jgi:hypothetical protein
MEVDMEPTKVQWSLGYTMNLGNFESLRLDVQVSDYVREGESTTQASDRVYKFTEEQLQAKVVEAKQEIGEGNG